MNSFEPSTYILHTSTNLMITSTNLNMLLNANDTGLKSELDGSTKEIDVFEMHVI